MWRAVFAFIEWVTRKIQYKGRIEDKLDSVLSRQNDSERRLLRLEIMEAMRRDDRAVVHQLYDEYKSMKGNSYMNELYKDYCKKPKQRSKR